MFNLLAERETRGSGHDDGQALSRGMREREAGFRSQKFDVFNGRDQIPRASGLHRQGFGPDPDKDAFGETKRRSFDKRRGRFRQ